MIIKCQISMQGQCCEKNFQAKAKLQKIKRFRNMKYYHKMFIKQPYVD